MNARQKKKHIKGVVASMKPGDVFVIEGDSELDDTFARQLISVLPKGCYIACVPDKFAVTNKDQIKWLYEELLSKE